MDLYSQNSSNNHFQLNSSYEIKKVEYTRDGWTFEENKIYENAMVDFEDTSSVQFFQYVARLMPWQTMESIKKHDQILMEDINFINSSNGNFEDIVEEDIQVEEETRKIEMKEEIRSVTRRPKKRGIPWTMEEHELFLRGLQEVGKGEWKTISRKYLPHKTSAQIASHAQKFEKRKYTKTPPEKRRRSINDITLCSQSNFSLNSSRFQPNQLGFLANSQHFKPNQLTIPLGSKNFQSNQLNFSPNFHQNQLGMDSQLQPNQFNFSLSFQQNQLGMNSQDFQFQNTTSYNHVHNNY